MCVLFLLLTKKKIIHSKTNNGDRKKLWNLSLKKTVCVEMNLLLLIWTLAVQNLSEFSVFQSHALWNDDLFDMDLWKKMWDCFWKSCITKKSCRKWSRFVEGEKDPYMKYSYRNNDNASHYRRISNELLARHPGNCSVCGEVRAASGNTTV